MLMGLNGEQFRLTTANQRPETHLDISGTGFWTPGQRTFLDVRVFDLNAQRHKNLELQKCYKRNEDEKKRMYNERILQVENATFTPLVFRHKPRNGILQKILQKIGSNDIWETVYWLFNSHELCANKIFFFSKFLWKMLTWNRICTLFWVKNEKKGLDTIHNR